MTNKTIRLLLIGILSLFIFYLIYNISKIPLGVETIFNAIMLISAVVGIRYHTQNIHEPLGQEMKNSFVFFLVTVFIASVLAFGMYIYYTG